MKNKQRTTNENTNISMTSCHKGGIKIRDTGNENATNPFANLNPFRNNNEERNIPVLYNNNLYSNIDLNIENYSREDLFKLFGIKNMCISEDVMKFCKKTVLKTHPDKSRLDEKYFIFFSKAYKKLQGIYEFQNKTIKKNSDTNEYFNSSDNNILDKVFDTNKQLKDPKNFNKWFNNQFDNHKLEDPNETGYGSWLKSDEDIYYCPNVTKSNMASEIEKRKKQVQTLTSYTGVSDQCSSSFGGSTLMAYDNNFTSNTLFSNDGIGYTDLRQAYIESVIPVTDEDYKKTQQFKSIEEYKRHRDSISTTPLNAEESMFKLFNENKQKDEESAALAFYYAQQSEKVKKNSDNFWSGLKQLSN